MWKDLKDKMKRLFEQEENHAEEAAVHKEEKKDVNAKTKMTYRYPKQGEFRFPVIPDQDQERREHVSRARSERRRHVQEEEPEVEKRPQRRQRKQPEPEEELKETLETTSIPFTPSDVPSPIFGYQTRQMTKGLQNLEYTVEENSKPEFYTGSYEEKKWQDLREKLRERVQVGRKQPDAVTPSEGEPERESRQEGAASLEMEVPVQEELPNRNEELSKLKNDSMRDEHTEETPADKESHEHEDTSTVDLEMHALNPGKGDSSVETGSDQEVHSEAPEEETYRYRLQDIFDQDSPTIDKTNAYGNGEVYTEEEKPENEETQDAPFEDDTSEAAERPFINEEEEEAAPDSVGELPDPEEYRAEEETAELEVEMETERTEVNQAEFEESEAHTAEDVSEAAERPLINEEEEEAAPDSVGELPDPEEYRAEEETAELEVETETERTEVNQPESQDMETHSAENEAGDRAEGTEELPDAGTGHEAVSELDEQERGTEEDMEPQPLGEKPSGSREDQEETRKSSSRRSVPFNVLMTPRDKRSRDHQKTEAPKQEEPKPETVQTKEAQVEKPAPEQEEEAGRRPPEYVRSEYQTPLHLLEDPVRPSTDDDSWITGQMELLETTLRHFHVRANVINAMKGPSVTRFEVQPEPGVKVSKITNLADDIKLSMAAKDIRIEAPIPGKQAVGIEVPNKQPQMVGLQEIFEDEAFSQEQSPLSVGLGLDIGGESIVTNLKKMPHGLIAGATGSGKSVCINTILVSLLYKAHYDDVKFLLIDPKMVELAPYNDLPHLVAPVITDVKAATTALKWAVKEMEERYEKFVAEGVRDVERFNDKMIKQGRASEKLPYLVIVIDELADLMMVSPQDVEDAICRIAQKARACGIHLLLATQRPSVDVITGLIKANIPTRIAFSVSSQVDSRTIIDSSGAEKLLGKGDMLFVENGSGQPVRIQGAFVSDDEIERVTSFVKKMAPPQYLFHQDELIKQVSTEEETDELFDEAVDFVLAQNGASASLIQRRFKVGYNRAARLIDQMEDYGIISEQKGSKPRDVLLTRQQIEEIMD